MKYELDWHRRERDNRWFIGVLTGLPYDEIKAACPAGDCWGGQAFVMAFRKLGFNTTPRWVKFDPGTDKPCIIRTTSEKKGYWHAWIYNDGLVNNSYTLEQFTKEFPEDRITSMLQVWI